MSTLQVEPHGVVAAPRGRRSRRAYKIAAAVTGVIALAGFVQGFGDVLSGPAALPRATPTIPEVIAGDSLMTASVRSDPAGRAIALFISGNAELFFSYHAVVVGADGGAIRRVSAMNGRRRNDGPFPEALIAPDGTRLLVSDGASARLVDLTTGRERSYRLGRGSSATPLAWSPDGRHVAFTPDPTGAGAGGIGMLDLKTGGTSGVPGLAVGASGPTAAAFDADGTRLAVQIDEAVELIMVSGGHIATLPLPRDHQLVPYVAWSPDGALLATRSQRPESQGGIVFLSTQGRSLPPNVASNLESSPAEFGGWSAPDRIVMVSETDRHPDYRVEREVVEVSLATGKRRVISWFSGAHTCEFSSMHCKALNVRFAAGLLPTLVTRPAGPPDRGPWPVPLTMSVILTFTGAAWLAFKLARHLRRRFA